MSTKEGQTISLSYLISHKHTQTYFIWIIPIITHFYMKSVKWLAKRSALCPPLVI